MATKTNVVLEDDLTGETENVETVSFGVAGTQYEIDLTHENAEELRGLFSKYIEAGRKAGRQSQGRTAVRHTTTDSIDPTAVRRWAEAKGITVNARGRISKDVVEQYRAAGN
jgi:hypothetical protein